MTDSKIYRTAALLISSVIVLSIMILAKSFLIPLAWSLVIALASFRMLSRMERKFRINRFVSSLLFVAFILASILFIFYFFSSEVYSIIKGIPALSQNLAEDIRNTLTWLESYGIHLPLIDQAQIHQWVSDHSAIISKALVSFGKNLGGVALIAVYLFFMLYYRRNYLYYLRLRNKTEEVFVRAKEETMQVAAVISSFLNGLFFTTLIVAVMLYVIFLIIGLKFALFFAILVALLSLIPYVGTPAGMAIIFLFALVSGNGLTLPLLALAGMIITNTMKSYVFKPVIIGSKIKLNAFVIFISVIIGGLIWGVAGMILFMPLAGVAKVLLASNEKTKPLVALLVTLPKDAFNPSSRVKEEHKP